MQKILYSTILFVLFGNISSCSTSENGTKVTNSQSEPAPQTETQNKSSSNVQYQIIENENHTFGYEITANGTVMVKQPFIPAVAGKQGFASKEEAEKVAQLIVKKVEKNIIPPAISVKELDSLHIHYNK